MVIVVPSFYRQADYNIGTAVCKKYPIRACQNQLFRYAHRDWSILDMVLLLTVHSTFYSTYIL